MTDDLVNRLHKLDTSYDHVTLVEYCRKSADRIEELENALEKIAKHDLQAIAMDALRPHDRIPALEGKVK